MPMDKLNCADERSVREENKTVAKKTANVFFIIGHLFVTPMTKRWKGRLKRPEPYVLIAC
jgi:hypothetical protein